MTTRVVSFDRNEEGVGIVVEPERRRSLDAALAGEGPLAVRGAGLSYCLASGGDRVTTIDNRHFTRLLAFDRAERLVRVESGLPIGDLVRFAVANDSYFPVLPGYPAITVGGCLGFNVHGKTQHNVGNFCDHLESFTLRHPDHGELFCSREENRHVFDLTVGGMGLTGYVAEVTLRLAPLAGASVTKVAHRVGSLDEAVEAMISLQDDADALYSWNDLNAKGPHLGRGLVYEERFVAEVRKSRVGYNSMNRRARVPMSLYSPLSSRLINFGYRARDRVRPSVTTSVADAAFPINGNEIYYDLFGRAGFREYQFIVSHDAWPSASTAVRGLLERAEVPVTLGSLKLFAGEARNLWFGGDGVCLTLDVPACEAAVALFERLDELVVDHGGVVNLAKDSRLGAAAARAVFPAYEEFREALAGFDPNRRFDSALRRRLEL